METVRQGAKRVQHFLGLSSPIPVYFAGAVLVGTVTLWLLRKYFAGGACRNKNRLDGKTVIITGANTGIGKETAIELAKRGAKIYMGCRSTQRGEKALEEVKASSGSKEVFLLKIDLASKRSVREFADNFLSRESHLHILINNAGIMQVPEGRTEDGFERQIGTNHLGHFYLTYLLLDTLKKSAPSRIINVASLAHAFSKIDLDDLNITKVKYSSTTAYGNSKEANMLHALELARRLKGTGVTAYSLHPGAVHTELHREWNFLLAVSAFQSIDSCMVSMVVPGIYPIKFAATNLSHEHACSWNMLANYHKV